MTKRWKTAAVTSAAPLALLTGCYLTTDLSGYSGTAGPALEAGPDAPAPVDGGPGERDASDAGDAAPADGGFDCQPGDFCDDFERPTSDVRGPWDRVDLGADGGLELTANAFRGERALRVIAAADNGTAASVVTTRSRAGRISVSFRLYFERSVPRSLGIMPVQVFNERLRFNQVFLSVSGSNVKLAEQELVSGLQTYFQQSPALPVRFGAWVPVTIDLDFTTDPGTMRATYDGKVLADAPLEREWAPTPFDLRAGLNYGAAGVAGSFDIDDVVLRTAP